MKKTWGEQEEGTVLLDAMTWGFFCILTEHKQREVLTVIVILWAGKQEVNGFAHITGYQKFEIPSVVHHFML